MGGESSDQEESVERIKVGTKAVKLDHARARTGGPKTNLPVLGFCTKAN